MAIFVCGDLHGHWDISKLNSKKFKEGRHLTKEDVLIQLGDFGLIFHNKRTKDEQYWLDWLGKKKWTTVFIDGNHDNHPQLNELPVEEKFGEVVGTVNDSVFHLKRGRVYTIQGKTFWTMGGAFSIDKARRIEGRDWWPEEEPSFTETKEGYESLDRVGWKVDYMITHDCPTWVKDVLHSPHHTENSYTNRLLEDIFGKQKLQFTHHYFGHHHMDHTVDKHTCCYNKVYEIVK